MEIGYYSISLKNKMGIMRGYVLLGGLIIFLGMADKYLSEVGLDQQGIPARIIGIWGILAVIICLLEIFEIKKEKERTD